VRCEVVRRVAGSVKGGQKTIGIPGLRPFWGALTAAFWLSSALVSAQAPAPRSLEVELPAGRLVGLPIHWSESEGVLLQASGQMQFFEMRQLVRHRLLGEPFTPQALTEARQQLLAELGSGFDAVVAGPYVIAAPKGQAGRWLQRFTSLLAGYSRYFEVRGWGLRKPDFPLCVIVFPSREEFVRYAAREGQAIPSLAVGSYFPKSNRCVLYQLPNSESAVATRQPHVNWEQTEATIVHEAIHQLAYNTGVHERLFENPLWFVEGLATLFERPAVYDTSRSRISTAERMQPEMLGRLKPLLANPTELARRIEGHILNDQLFKSSPIEAYDLAWGMTFTLTERMPAAYGQYINFQAARRFGSYEPAQRISDFRTAFEISPAELALMMQRLLRQ
jgi:hypothetical protein